MPRRCLRTILGECRLWTPKFMFPAKWRRYDCQSVHDKAKRERFSGVKWGIALLEMPAVSQLSRLSPRDSRLHWLCYTPCMRVSHPKLRRSFSSAGHVFFQGICWQGQATTCLQIPFTPAAGDYSHFNTFIFFLETLLLHVFISLLLHFLIRFPSPFHFPHRAGWFPRSVIRF